MQNNLKKILVVDPASVTGYALVEINEKDEARIYEYGYVDVDVSSPYMGDWCISLMDRIKDIMIDHCVDEIAIEDYFFGGKFASGSSVNTHYRAAIHIQARRSDIPYTILNVTEWKKHIAGKARPGPNQKKKWGKEASKKIYIQEALWHKYGVRFPNHSISEKTGKPVFFKYDVVDAVAMAYFYLEKYLGVKSILMDVSIPEDVQFKKTRKAYFNYQED